MSLSKAFPTGKELWWKNVYNRATTSNAFTGSRVTGMREVCKRDCSLSVGPCCLVRRQASRCRSVQFWGCLTQHSQHSGTQCVGASMPSCAWGVFFLCVVLFSYYVPTFLAMGCDFTQACQEAVDLNQWRSHFSPMMSGSQLASGKLELTFTPPSSSLCH